MLDNITLEKHLKAFQRNLTIISLVLGLLASLGVCYGFYYNTNSRLDTHTTEIGEVKKDIKDLTSAVNSTAVFQGVSKEQIMSLEKQLNEVKQSQVRIETTLGTVANELIKQNKSK